VVGASTDPVSGQPELKATPVRVTPVAVEWRGLLLRASEQLPHGPYYWARVPIERGNAFTLLGYEALPSGRGTEMWITALLDAPPNADLVIYADPRRSIFRYASFAGSRRLEACLFIARDATSVPACEAIQPLLGAKIEADFRRSLLAGQTTNPKTACGATICTCFDVGLDTLRRAIASGKVVSLAEIGTLLRAGTNCGSCIPEIKAILRSTGVRDSTNSHVGSKH
jgi:assimilatory nitrate reductase catalytic subunit